MWYVTDPKWQNAVHYHQVKSIQKEGLLFRRPLFKQTDLSSASFHGLFLSLPIIQVTNSSLGPGAGISLQQD
jgi:hypothetical protein